MQLLLFAHNSFPSVIEENVRRNSIQAKYKTYFKLFSVVLV